MPYPFEGRHFNYRDKNIPILGRSDLVHTSILLVLLALEIERNGKESEGHHCLFRFNGNKDVVLHLPPGTTVDQLK